MKKKRASFKARHGKNIKKGQRCPLLTGLTRSSGDGQRFPSLVWRGASVAMPYVNFQDKAVLDRPEKYPAKYQGGMSHGPKLIKSYV